MPNDSSDYVVGLRQLLLGFSFGVAQPSNVEIVISRLDLLAREASPSTLFALILALRSAVWIVTVSFFESREVLQCERPRLAERGIFARMS